MMRLLDVRSITLLDEGAIQRRELALGRTYDSDTDVCYAILSHRWGNDGDEVSFVDIQTPDIARRKAGFDKIKQCCKQAEKDGYDYLWVDTCCIDKSSSAELQESINSMYRWYEQSEVCYAYLRDVYPGSSPIEKDDWFTRGWTLQELLAPKVVEFFDRDWSRLGDKRSLVLPIHEATGIRELVLTGTVDVFDCSVAERMSWAAKRRTKRVEDSAYSLFGVFQVNMPMLYGEGDKAFHRLQEEILKISDDPTIFAWSGLSETHCGLLAPNIAAFRDSEAFVPSHSPSELGVLALTRRGISVTTRLYPWCTDTYLAFIGCKKVDLTDVTIKGDRIIGIYLRMLEEKDQFARVKVRGRELALLRVSEYIDLYVNGYTRHKTMYKPNTMNTWARQWTVFVRQQPLPPRLQHHTHERIYGFRVSLESLVIHSKDRKLFKARAQHWDEKERTMWIDNGSRQHFAWDHGVVGVLSPTSVWDAWGKAMSLNEVHLGFDESFKPTVVIIKRAPWAQIPARQSRDLRPGVVLGSFWRFLCSAAYGPRIVLPGSITEDNWFNKTAWQDGRWVVLDRSHRNFWAIQGDKNSNLNVSLGKSTGMKVRLEKVDTAKGVVWDFWMEPEQKRL